MEDIADVKRRLEVAERMAQHYEAKYQDTLTRYGTGVRPSYVSADLADIGSSISYYNREAAALRSELEASK